MHNSRFEEMEIITSETTIFLRRMGDGPPLLLLHGFPQTSLMWREVAPLLAKYFTVICADLRGYGRSGCPASDKTHFAYSKRAMAGDMIGIMGQLGFPGFSVAGHDRGGRVAYRMALDHPTHIDRLAVLDIIPVSEAWDLADKRMLTSFWPWSLLSQPPPLPETLIAGSPNAVIDDAATEWGTPYTVFPKSIRDAYSRQLSDPAHVHAICEEFRAAATVDADHDRKDQALGRKIKPPVLVLWSAEGPLGHWYTHLGGPLGIWSKWAEDVRGHAVQGGHFFPEEHPVDTANLLIQFFGKSGV